ncbi:MAG: DUF1281 family ferredoxin-like fold protein [Oryzihumus sp.]
MPNHVTTEVRGDQRALSSLLNDAGEVDFRHLVPEPANIETGGCSGQHDPGVICWYSWNVENWGTKWNAYDSEVEPGKVRFDTAWSHPFPIIKALSLAHPDETFEVRYADEDLGHNLADYTIRNGAIISERALQEGSPEARDFAAQLKYGKSLAALEAEWA